MALTGKQILFVGEQTGLEMVIRDRIFELGGNLVFCDNLDILTIESEIIQKVKLHGNFDGFVFTITHSDFRPLQFVSFQNLQKIFQDNFYLFIGIVRTLKKVKGLNAGSSIVAMSSISSIRAMKAKMAFSASKAALDAAIRCLAMELGDKGIRINSVQKGGVDTDFEKEHIQNINLINDNRTEKRQVLGITNANEVSNVIAFLLSDATKTITGSSIVIDGGYAL